MKLWLYCDLSLLLHSLGLPMSKIFQVPSAAMTWPFLKMIDSCVSVFLLPLNEMSSNKSDTLITLVQAPARFSQILTTLLDTPDLESHFPPGPQITFSLFLSADDS